MYTQRLGEHGRLARPRRRGDQHAHPVGDDALALRGRPNLFRCSSERVT